MNRTHLDRLLDATSGHLVAVDAAWSPLFGITYHPVCVEEGCYRGPHIASEARARAIAAEHSAKTAGTWQPAQ